MSDERLFGGHGIEFDPDERDHGRSHVELQRVADCLRGARQEFNDLCTSIIAFGNFDRWAEPLERAHRHAKRTLTWVDEVLAILPPPIPMTPEREAAVGRVIGAALDKRFGDGTEEDVKAAFDAWDAAP
jgi:hypothetical protein